MSSPDLDSVIVLIQNLIVRGMLDQLTSLAIIRTLSCNKSLISSIRPLTTLRFAMENKLCVPPLDTKTRFPMLSLGWSHLDDPYCIRRTGCDGKPEIPTVKDAEVFLRYHLGFNYLCSIGAPGYHLSKQLGCTKEFLLVLIRSNVSVSARDIFQNTPLAELIPYDSIRFIGTTGKMFHGVEGHIAKELRQVYGYANIPEDMVMSSDEAYCWEEIHFYHRSCGYGIHCKTSSH